MTKELSEEERERKRAWQREYARTHREERKAYNEKYYKVYYAANKERLKERAAQYRATHKEKAREVHAAYYQNNRDRLAEYRREHRDEKRRYAAAYNAAFRSETIRQYGGKCACCGEDRIEFLAIDHTNGNGNKHRRETGRKGGVAFYIWLKNNNYPDGFRVLCHNCNMSIGFYGYCPHNAK